VTDIKGALTVTIMEVGAEEIVLHPDVQDQHTWKLTSSGTYTWKSAKQTIFFCGHYSFCPLEKDLEILGSIALQIFLVAGSSEPLLYG
jgi:hypothetical protein